MTNGPYVVSENCLVFAKNIEEENERLRAENAKFYKQAEMNARLLTENSSLRADKENFWSQRNQYKREYEEAVSFVEKVRDDLSEEITRLRAAYEAMDKMLRESNQHFMRVDMERNKLRAENEKLRAAFRVNMLRAFPHMSHDEIDAEIAAAIRGSGE